MWWQEGAGFLDQVRLHPSFRFTMEKESVRSLSFLDVLVQRSYNRFLTSVYSKPTFTGLYTDWKILYQDVGKSIYYIRHCTLICSSVSLEEELSKIRHILLDNGYPRNVFTRFSFLRKISKVNSPPIYGSGKCPIYLKLPWMGKNAQGWWTRSILTFLSVNIEGIFPSFEKNKVHPFSSSSAVSYFKCGCDVDHVGPNHFTPAYDYQPAYSNLDEADWIICFNNEQQSWRWILLLANTWLKILFVLANTKRTGFILPIEYDLGFY